MLKIGDVVAMNDKYYVADTNKGKHFTVMSEPYDVCGTDCVKLIGYSGAYAADGLDVVTKNDPAEAATSTRSEENINI